ncbi:AlbA family DNA-binding domain-containing protein [Streptomyces geranii]|uniref:AlbA family DNA-binding domain-containing protein n=1 Tax=Streptomyces geranii TaxID=2058923 RepID=UPI000D04467E|nr:ATP-binding protein [Streptomyces geranii]
MRESEWVDFKGVGREGPYDLSLESKKYELAKDVAAFANAAGGLLVCGFKATRRPTDLHEAVVKKTPFAKRLVNTERYKAVIADLVRPSIGVEFSWHDDPDDPGLGCLVIEVPALPENARWALVTKTLNQDGKLANGGVAIPKRHGDDTRYLPPDTVYQLVNSGLRAMFPMPTTSWPPPRTPTSCSHWIRTVCCSCPAPGCGLATRANAPTTAR